MRNKLIAMPLFLGLDCGGSTTRARIEDETGTVVFEGRGGPANVASQPVEQWSASLRQSLEKASGVDAVAAGFAGLIGDDCRHQVRSVMEELFPATPLEVVADYVIAFEAAGAVDVLVLAGTGSVVCAKSNDNVFRLGGGGPWLGDEGSAFRIGQSALTLLMKGSLAPSSRLLDALMTEFRTTDLELIPIRLSSSESPAKSLAKFAQVVAEDSLTDDTLRKLVDFQMALLAKTASRIIEQSDARGKAEISVALTGGLWDAGDIYQRTFVEKLNSLTVDRDLIQQEPRQYHVERVTTPPVQGAVLMAKRLFYGH